VVVQIALELRKIALDLVAARATRVTSPAASEHHERDDHNEHAQHQPNNQRLAANPLHHTAG
jgi:hypothetical protein